MKNFLCSKEFWSIIEAGFSEPDCGVVITKSQLKVLDKERLKDVKAKNYLFQEIDYPILAYWRPFFKGYLEIDLGFNERKVCWYNKSEITTT